MGKARRAEPFKKILQWIAEMPGMSVVNAPYPYRDGGRIQLLDTFAALAIGTNRTMQARDAYAILICDEGRDKSYRNVVRVLVEVSL